MKFNGVLLGLHSSCGDRICWSWKGINSFTKTVGTCTWVWILCILQCTCSPLYCKFCWMNCNLPLGKWISVVNCLIHPKNPGCFQHLFVTIFYLVVTMILSDTVLSLMPVLWKRWVIITHYNYNYSILYIAFCHNLVVLYIICKSMCVSLKACTHHNYVSLEVVGALKTISHRTSVISWMVIWHWWVREGWLSVEDRRPEWVWQGQSIIRQTFISLMIHSVQ